MAKRLNVEIQDQPEQLDHQELEGARELSEPPEV